MAVDEFGTVTDLSTGDIIGGKDAKDFKDMIEAKAFDEAFSMSQFGGQQPDPDTTGVEAVGGREGTQSDDTGNVGVGGQTPGGGPESEAEAAGPDASEAAEAAGAFKGGFISKKKKQKKMKRGGLASR